MSLTHPTPVVELLILELWTRPQLTAISNDLFNIYGRLYGNYPCQPTRQQAR